MAAKECIGLDRITRARKRGLKPAKIVWVDVGITTRFWDQMQRQIGGPDERVAMIDADMAPGVPANVHVCLSPSVSVRMVDWSWCVGLKIQLDGDDLTRVEAAYERIICAGAEWVQMSCQQGDKFTFNDSRTSMGVIS